MEELHEANPGMSRMKALARSYVWWPTMNDRIKTVVKSCQQCQEHQNMPSRAPLHPWENTFQPWTRIHIDFEGPFLGEMFLLLVDSHSKWIEEFPLSPTNYGSKVTIECLRTVFATHRYV